MTQYKAIRGPGETDDNFIRSTLFPYKQWTWHGWMEPP
jgi:hypothetical protein